MIQVKQQDFKELLASLSNNSVDLICIDPPYLISRPSNFATPCKNNKCGNKYKNHSIDFGDWDKTDFDLNYLMSECYRVLKPSGTLIIWFDIWKSEQLKSAADAVNFKQPRIGQWQKTNPVPRNSKLNYLTNGIEYFFSFVKKSKPIFNSEYDCGIYQYPIVHGNERTIHPTQKPLEIIKDLILKHSNKGDLIVDCFCGSGTTAVACKMTDRNCICSDLNPEYIKITEKRLGNIYE